MERGRLFSDVDQGANPNIIGAYPHIYKALISQNAPIATTLNPAMVAGQIWTLESYDAADAAAIASLELISGTLNIVGSKYRSAIDQNLVYTGTTTLSYDGAPYVVSTNSVGAFAPFVNTLGGIPVYSYSSLGNFVVTLNGVFGIGKTIGRVPLSEGTYTFFDANININYVQMATFDTASPMAPRNGGLYYTPIEIEVNT